VSVSVCFLFTVSGLPIVLNFFSAWTPQALLDTIASFSFLTHFNDLSRGVIDLRDLVFFGSLIIGALLLNTVIVDAKRGS
ncbi:MAG: ABC transporter permease, partial [Rhodospirillales bacterium]|nr:ABC transporter permease [Rhodospirillales bacterium]